MIIRFPNKMEFLKVHIIVLFLACSVFSGPVDMSIDCSQPAGPFVRLYHQTGTPNANSFFSDSLETIYKQYVEYLGTVPHDGIKYMRFMWLLDLIAGTDIVGENAVYDWTLIDSLLDLHVENGLKIVAPIMGNPTEGTIHDIGLQTYSSNSVGAFFTFIQPQEIRAYYLMVKAFVQHCVDRYGIDEVRSWYFDSWNEPNTPFWRLVSRNLEKLEYFSYWDAASQGVKDVDSTFRFGGPGNAEGEFPRELFQHCLSGTNAITGEQGSSIDYFAVHIKTDADEMVGESVALIDSLRTLFPQLSDIPFMNGEADPLPGWTKDLTWRAGPNHAAFVCNSLNHHLLRIVDSLDSPVLSAACDDAYVGDWKQRTQFTLIGDRDNFALIKKPVHNVRTMLSLMGDTRCEVAGGPDIYTNAGVIATACDSQIAVLLFNEDLNENKAVTQDISTRIMVNDIPFSQGCVVHYRIDKSHSNPYRLWNSEQTPSVEHIEELRKNQELERIDIPKVMTFAGNSYTDTIDLPKNSVSLMLLCRKPAQAPAPVKNVRVKEYSGIDGTPEYLVLWDESPSKMMKTYEVLYAENAQSDGVRVNEPDIICSGFMHRGPSQKGFYSVRAVDYWGRGSDGSIQAAKKGLYKTGRHGAPPTRIISTGTLAGLGHVMMEIGVSGFSIYNLLGKCIFRYNRSNCENSATVSLPQTIKSASTVYVIRYK
ncbi:MAG: hypothetical protein GF401_15770 [Chitinivibrionales bacterium]|nr:hypothetical protein [Chitinivibrionales bacterium]